jgi:hypothetical protein
MHIEITNKHVNFTQPKLAFGQAVRHRSGREGIIVGMKFTGYVWEYEICFLKPMSIGKAIPEKELELKMVRAAAYARR